MAIALKQSPLKMAQFLSCIVQMTTLFTLTQKTTPHAFILTMSNLRQTPTKSFPQMTQTFFPIIPLFQMRFCLTMAHQQKC